MTVPKQLKPFKKGPDPRRNVTGANRGHNRFETDFNLAVEDIAKLNNLTFSDARRTLLKRGYSEASKGNYRFWQYILNQLYGSAPETMNMNIREQRPLDEPEKPDKNDRV